GQTGELSGAVAGLGASGFEAREVEQGVDQFQQAQCAALNHGKLLGFVAREITGRLTQKLLERAEHQGERGAKFMADIAEEKSLGAVDRSQRIIALPLQLKGSRFGQACAELTGHHGVEGAIVLVQVLARVYR